MGAMDIRRFGYARVPSKDQNLARQISTLKEAGIDKRNIFTDRQSGKDFDKVADAVRQKKISLRKGAGMLGISYTTLRNWMKRQENKDI